MTTSTQPEKNNRRLLELAARTAGITGSYWRGQLPSGAPIECIEIDPASSTPDGVPQRIWNSLADTRDALALALLRHMEIKHGNGVVVVSSKEGWSASARVSINPFNFNDYFASTRLAITEVAAKIEEERAAAEATQYASA
ncbi:hypothetical protein [Burkholderia gladioli]|uniref:hypothetical protein n=1 Tax=Burkholderia gladioli TaxID=28095 RepID=UPI00164063BD|nr:hypothetical protein [Burkholderia gladioli]